MTNPCRIAIVIAAVSVGCMSGTPRANLSADASPDSDTAANAPSTRIALSVALPHPFVGSFACFDVLIRNGAGETVAELGDRSARFISDTPDTNTLCSSATADAPGALTFHAPCDAQHPDHSVTVWVDGLYADSPSGAFELEILDPCPDGCTLPVTCTEDADAPVAFKLAAMPFPWSSHHPAFVLGDAYCESKADCTYRDEYQTPLEVLVHPTTGRRDQTAVLALTCLPKPNGEVRALFWDSIVVDCDGHITVLDPTLAPGHAYTESHPDPDPDDAIWQYAVYSGTEPLHIGDVTYRKPYWNIAIGFDPDTPNCTLTAAATALPAASADFTTPPVTTWPFFSFESQLTGPTGGLACTQNDPELAPAPVSIVYTPIDTPKTFCHRFDGDTEPVTHASCAP